MKEGQGTQETPWLVEYSFEEGFAGGTLTSSGANTVGAQSGDGTVYTQEIYLNSSLFTTAVRRFRFETTPP